MIERDPRKIDQCLFGYADGHRLLASSLRLAGDVASDLTAASDIAPGVRFTGSNGYWTGFPVPHLGRYGLMRTWPAPEMPRPGCVWTHLLLFDPALFETVDDLSCFETLARRPTGSDDEVGYSEPVSLPQQETVMPPGPIPSADRRRVIEILEVLYGNSKGPVGISRPGELDELVFLVWSQQWPKLRRNFRFQTAATMGVERASQRFDLQLRIDPPSQHVITLDRKEEAWLEVAVHDVDGFSNHGLRSFFRRYGQDVKRQRGSFRPLAQLYATGAASLWKTDKDVPAAVARWFPEPDDALTLKRDLMDGVILADMQVEAVLYLCEVDEGRCLPAPSEAGLRKLAGNWQHRAFDLMRLAEWAATRQGELPDGLLSTVSKVVPPADFWRATETFPEMRRRMISNEPALLDAEAIGALDPAALLVLVDAVAGGHDLGTVLVRRLPTPVDRRVVTTALERFPKTVLSASIEKANEFGLKAAGDWLQEISTIPSIILDPAVMAKIRRASIVVAIAEALDWLSGDVIKHGLRPWTAALDNAEDDLTQADRDRLEAFQFTLAVSTGGDQAQDVFERSFGYLHERIMNSYLPWTALQLLESKLPSLGWMRDWDKGLKLRLAVTRAYLRFNLDPQSFGRLLRDKKERKMLRRAAEEIDGADRFADSLRD